MRTGGAGGVGLRHAPELTLWSPWLWIWMELLLWATELQRGSTGAVGRSQGRKSSSANHHHFLTEGGPPSRLCPPRVMGQLLSPVLQIPVTMATPMAMNGVSWMWCPPHNRAHISTLMNPCLILWRGTGVAPAPALH